ncbi:Na-translocating system protein MpsC family protein [Niallia oryzisoli]|uniref:Na-translocating system protein MpsC family protein n=1 Tax=Niallia oryzisoli TaxID=1737571 RepID=UPI0037363A89
MITTTQENMQYLSSKFSKLIKRRFGKGPETCYVMQKGKRFYVYMRNFITPAEEVLICNNELNLATNFRSTVINTVIKDYIPEVEKTLGILYEYFRSDWDYDRNTGILVFEIKDMVEEKIEVSFEKSLLKLLDEIGSKTHKKAACLKIVSYSQNICTVESKQVLLQLERFVYQKGDYDLLLHQARDIKKEYMDCKGLFEGIFNRSIEDIFIIWDYEKDRNDIVFIFNKEYRSN